MDHMRSLSLILALAAGWPAFATTHATINPVAGVRAAKLEWQMGNALSRNQRVARRLFEGDAERLAAFRRKLEAAIQKRLSESGIQLSRDAKHTLVLGIWGQTRTAARPPSPCSKRHFTTSESSTIPNTTPRRSKSGA